MDAGADVGKDAGQTRLNVQDAARYLGVSEGAIRKRVARGTLRHDKEPDGRVYVYLDERDRRGVDDGQDEGVSPKSDALISQMQARIDDLREQLEAEREANRENRRIIAGLAQRIPELEPPRQQEPPGESESASEEYGRGDVPVGPEKGSEERTEARPSLWRRLFGGEPR